MVESLNCTSTWGEQWDGDKGGEGMGDEFTDDGRTVSNELPDFDADTKK